MLQLVAPLGSVAAKAMDKDEGAPVAVGGNVNCAQPDKRLGGDADLPAVKLDVDVHS